MTQHARPGMATPTDAVRRLAAPPLFDAARGETILLAEAVKIKVGGPDLAEDVARLSAVREALGDDFLVMIDANQRWGVEGAIEAGKAFAPLAPFWFEEPVHPDDILGYTRVARALAPMRIAGGEHLSNQVLFKNLIRAGGVGIVQPDAVRLGGLPEYLAVALMAAKADLPALPHVGDMGSCTST